MARKRAKVMFFVKRHPKNASGGLRVKSKECILGSQCFWRKVTEVKELFKIAGKPIRFKVKPIPISALSEKVIPMNL